MGSAPVPEPASRFVAAHPVRFEGLTPSRLKEYYFTMGQVGIWELLAIFVVALLVFGPRKLPELGRSLGKGLSEFRRASTELRSSLEREMHSIEQETKIEDSTEIPAEDSIETPVEVSAETPVGDSTETPVEVSAETPVEVSAETPVEVSTETPVEVPGETPAEVSTSSATVHDGNSNSGASSGERQD